jgi:hypothetical protein
LQSRWITSNGFYFIHYPFQYYVKILEIRDLRFIAERMCFMVNSDTDMLFPLKIIPTLGDLRGSDWQALVAKLSDDQAETGEKIAFTFLMVKLAGCSGCNADSFRAMRGCAQCSRQTIKRFKGSDTDLLKNYRDCQKEVQTYLSKRDQ